MPILIDLRDHDLLGPVYKKGFEEVFDWANRRFRRGLSKAK